MLQVPGYPKIFVLGEAHTENVFSGDVYVQEKVDGSLFAFGVNEEGEIAMRSKSKLITPEFVDEMFTTAVNYVLSIEERILAECGPDTYFYCEYLKRPKHNTLNYERTPLNNLYLFDCLRAGSWAPPVELPAWATLLEIDCVRTLHRGHANMNVITKLLDQDSFLGREKIEGVVIKNYGQLIEVGPKIIPLFAKYVVERFKERHADNPEFKKGSDVIGEFIDSFRTEARWRKALQHLRDDGELEQHMRDIPKLIHEIQQDLKEEEEENIKRFFYNHYLRRILASAVKGMPEWYKEYLINENIAGE